MTDKLTPDPGGFFGPRQVARADKPTPETYPERPLAEVWADVFDDSDCGVLSRGYLRLLADNARLLERADTIRTEVDENLIRALAKKRERGAMSIVNPTPDSADYWQGKADALRVVRYTLAATKVE